MNTEYQDPFTYTTKLISRFDGGAPRAATQALELIRRGKIKKAAELLKTIPLADLCLGCHVKNPEAGEEIKDADGEVIGEQPSLKPDESMLPAFLGGPVVDADADVPQSEEEEAVADALEEVEPDEEGKPKRKKKGGR